MAGGESQDFERALPIFNALGKTITHMGPLGAGGFTKLANQIIVAINLTAIGEALVFGAKAGVDPQKMIRALAGGLAGSKCLDQKSEKILSGDFAPGFKIDLHSKDLSLIQDAARSIGVPIPTAALVEQFFAALRVRGRGGLDHSAVITLFEDLAGVQVRRRKLSIHERAKSAATFDSTRPSLLLCTKSTASSSGTFRSMETIASRKRRSSKRRSAISRSTTTGRIPAAAGVEECRISAG